MYRFEKLRVYQHAIDLVEEVYKMTKLLPKEEKFALNDQLKRSSTSVILNIAEGSIGWGDAEFKRFLKISLRSLYETVAGLKIAEKLFKTKMNNALAKCEIVGKELNALIKYLRPKTKDQGLRTKPGCSSERQSTRMGAAQRALPGGVHQQEMGKRACVYLLKSLKDGKRYLGSTLDLEKRIKTHNKGLVKSTKSRRPLILIGYQDCKNIKEAASFEQKYKRSHDALERAIKRHNFQLV